MDQNQQVNELKDKLVILGAEEADLDQIIQDVNDIVFQRSIQEYLSTVQNPSLLEATRNLSGQELIEYVKSHASEFPPFPEERLKQIAEETWKDYFEFMSQE